MKSIALFMYYMECGGVEKALLLIFCGRLILYNSILIYIW